ncbi:MAG: DUF1761 domain-containing protein [Chitinophagaceae bacterium]
MNFYIVFLTALVPLLVGFLWYNPKIFGTAWMNASGMTEEKAKGANMPLIFGLTYVLGLFLSTALYPMVIHQMGVFSVLQTPDFNTPNSEASLFFKDFYSKYGSNFRTFKHGVFHGVLGGLFIGLPIIAVNALFERKGFKYIAINVGYWVISMAIMGGIICQWA